MRSAALFVAGLITGLAVTVGVAQNANTHVAMLNHVGINVPNIPDAIKYYNEKMGYREAFRVTGNDGQPTLVYMHISKDTFLEIQQSGPNRPAGFTHYGLVVDNAAAAVAAFKGRGAVVSDVTSSAGTKANLANITDPYMGRVELVEITPDSLHAKAIANWK
jgi:catechol 2,3-dioxygenase-like lactoylglutathione lyase family enzyme